MSDPIVPVRCYRCGGNCMVCICAPCPRCDKMLCASCSILSAKDMRRDDPIPKGSRPKPKHVEPEPQEKLEIIEEPEPQPYSWNGVLVPTPIHRVHGSEELLPEHAREIANGIKRIFAMMGAGIVAGTAAVFISTAALFGDWPE